MADKTARHGNIQDPQPAPKDEPDVKSITVDDQTGQVVDADIKIEKYPGRHGKIGKPEIQKADEILATYRHAKQPLEEKIKENEQWWRMRHWDTVPKVPGKEDQTEPASGWLFNSITNKHADFMDNIPEPHFLPREESDEEEARILQKVIPTIMEANDYDEVYSQETWYKLIHGTGVYGVFWDSSKENGLGDVDLRMVDLKNLYWEPGVLDIQDTPNLFNVQRVDAEILKDTYPFLPDELQGHTDDRYEDYRPDSEDPDHNATDEDKLTVVDWYYKSPNSDGRLVMHYCKYVEDVVIYASENDDRYKETGYYDHGMYPYVFDIMFPIGSSCVGFGVLDVMKSPQLYIDKLDQIILQNAAMSGKKRYFVKNNSSVNEQEFADWSKDFVHVDGGSLDDNLKEIDVSPVPSFIINHYQLKIDELKETSGNRDFSQGSTAAGVTAASAIAALQEAGSKLSRDSINSTYRSIRNVALMVMELVRQFYTEKRAFRIDQPNGSYEFLQYDNSKIRPQTELDPATGQFFTRVPVFDIKIVAQKRSPFSTTAQNELAKELYGLGVFNPQLATQTSMLLDMMDFEGIDKIKQEVGQNGTLEQIVQQITQLSMQMATALDQISGHPVLEQQLAQLIAQATGQDPSAMMAQTSAGGTMNQQAGEKQDDSGDEQAGKQSDDDKKKSAERTNSAGILPSTPNTIATNARARTAARSTPRS